MEELLGLGYDVVYAFVEAGQNLPARVSRIETVALEEFYKENRSILSDKVRGWMDWLGWSGAAAATASPSAK